MKKRAESMPLSAMPLFADQYARKARVADYDVSERRSGGDPVSAAANARAAEAKQRDREQVYAEVLRAGSRGLTCAEFATLRGKAGQLARFSGRFSELRDLGMIARIAKPDGSPALRGGCGVWTAAAAWKGARP